MRLRSVVLPEQSVADQRADVCLRLGAPANLPSGATVPAMPLQRLIGDELVEK